jgi:hypothetical protein
MRDTPDLRFCDCMMLPGNRMIRITEPYDLSNRRARLGYEWRNHSLAANPLNPLSRNPLDASNDRNSLSKAYELPNHNLLLSHTYSKHTLSFPCRRKHSPRPCHVYVDTAMKSPFTPPPNGSRYLSKGPEILPFAGSNFCGLFSIGVIELASRRHRVGRGRGWVP